MSDPEAASLRPTRRACTGSTSRGDPWPPPGSCWPWSLELEPWPRRPSCSSPPCACDRAHPRGHRESRRRGGRKAGVSFAWSRERPRALSDPWLPACRWLAWAGACPARGARRRSTRRHRRRRRARSSPRGWHRGARRSRPAPPPPVPPPSSPPPPSRTWLAPPRRTDRSWTVRRSPRGSRTSWREARLLS